MKLAINDKTGDTTIIMDSDEMAQFAAELELLVIAKYGADPAGTQYQRECPLVAMLVKFGMATFTEVMNVELLESMKDLKSEIRGFIDDMIKRRTRKDDDPDLLWPPELDA